jgi:Ribonuclease G/E
MNSDSRCKVCGDTYYMTCNTCGKNKHIKELEQKLAEAERKLKSFDAYVMRDEKLKIAVKALEFYAHVNNPNDLGSWDMRRNFIFDIIQADDCDQAHYDIDKYRFGGKRAREALNQIKRGKE